MFKDIPLFECCDCEGNQKPFYVESEARKKLQCWGETLTACSDHPHFSGSWFWHCYLSFRTQIRLSTYSQSRHLLPNRILSPSFLLGLAWFFYTLDFLPYIIKLYFSKSSINDARLGNPWINWTIICKCTLSYMVWNIEWTEKGKIKMINLYLNNQRLKESTQSRHDCNTPRESQPIVGPRKPDRPWLGACICSGHLLLPLQRVRPISPVTTFLCYIKYDTTRNDDIFNTQKKEYWQIETREVL